MSEVRLNGLIVLNMHKRMGINQVIDTFARKKRGWSQKSGQNDQNIVDILFVDQLQLIYAIEFNFPEKGFFQQEQMFKTFVFGVSINVGRVRLGFPATFILLSVKHIVHLVATENGPMAVGTECTKREASDRP